MPRGQTPPPNILPNKKKRSTAIVEESRPHCDCRDCRFEKELNNKHEIKSGALVPSILLSPQMKLITPPKTHLAMRSCATTLASDTSPTTEL